MHLEGNLQDEEYRLNVAKQNTQNYLEMLLKCKNRKLKPKSRSNRSRTSSHNYYNKSHKDSNLSFKSNKKDFRSHSGSYENTPIRNMHNKYLTPPRSFKRSSEDNNKLIETSLRNKSQFHDSLSKRKQIGSRSPSSYNENVLDPIKIFAMKKDLQKSYSKPTKHNVSYNERKSVSKNSIENNETRKSHHVHARCQACFKEKNGNYQSQKMDSIESRKNSLPRMSATLSSKNKGIKIIAWDYNTKIGSPPKKRLKFLRIKSPNHLPTDEYSHNSGLMNSIDTEDSKKNEMRKLQKCSFSEKIKRNSHSCQSFGFENKKSTGRSKKHKNSNRSKNFDESMTNSYERSSKNRISTGSSCLFERKTNHNLKYQKKLLEEIKKIRSKNDYQKKAQILEKIKGLDKELKSNRYKNIFDNPNEKNSTKKSYSGSNDGSGKGNCLIKEHYEISDEGKDYDRVNDDVVLYKNSIDLDKNYLSPDYGVNLEINNEESPRNELNSHKSDVKSQKVSKSDINSSKTTSKEKIDEEKIIGNNYDFHNLIKEFQNTKLNKNHKKILKEKTDVSIDLDPSNLQKQNSYEIKQIKDLQMSISSISNAINNLNSNRISRNASKNLTKNNSQKESQNTENNKLQKSSKNIEKKHKVDSYKSKKIIIEPRKSLTNEHSRSPLQSKGFERADFKHGKEKSDRSLNDYKFPHAIESKRQDHGKYRSSSQNPNQKNNSIIKPISVRPKHSLSTKKPASVDNNRNNCINGKIRINLSIDQQIRAQLLDDKMKSEINIESPPRDHKDAKENVSKNHQNLKIKQLIN